MSANARATITSNARAALVGCLYFVFGRSYMDSAAQAESARRRRDESVAALMGRSGSVTEEEFEDLAARTLLLEITRAEREERRPLWRHPRRAAATFVGLVTLVGLIGVTFDANSIPVEIDANVDQIRAVIAESDSGSAIVLGLHDLRCQALELSGVLGPPDGAPGGPGEVLAVRSVAGEIEPPQHVVVREVQLPRGAILAMELQGNVFILRIDRPAVRPREGEQAPSLDYRIVLDVPERFEGQTRGVGGTSEYRFRRSTLGPAIEAFDGTLHLSAPVELRMTLDFGAMDAVTPLGFQGIDLSDLWFGDYRTSVDRRPRSYLLGGELSFPGRDIESIALRYGESLSLKKRDAGSPSGQLVLVRLVNMPMQGRDASEYLPEQRLHLLWAGRARAIELGRESLRESRMPKMIFAWIGSRQQLYLLGVIIYAGILALSLLVRTRPGATDSLQPTELMSS